VLRQVSVENNSKSCCPSLYVTPALFFRRSAPPYFATRERDCVHTSSARDCRALCHGFRGAT
jgi:hypothetical protein